MASRVASAVQLFSLPLLHYLSGMRRLSRFWMLPNGVNTHTEDIPSDIVAIFTGNRRRLSKLIFQEAIYNAYDYLSISKSCSQNVSQNPGVERTPL